MIPLTVWIVGACIFSIIFLLLFLSERNNDKQRILKKALQKKDDEEGELRQERRSHIRLIAEALDYTKSDSDEETRMFLLLDKMNLSYDEWEDVSREMSNERETKISKIFKRKIKLIEQKSAAQNSN